MNKRSLASLIAGGVLLAGFGIAHADGFHSASTPEHATVTTPRVATSTIVTSTVATPAVHLDAALAPILLPFGVGVGPANREVSMSAATPDVSTSVDLPVVTVTGVDG